MTLSDRLDSERTNIKCRICNHFLIFRSCSQTDFDYNQNDHYHYYCGFCKKFICRECGDISFETWYYGTEKQIKLNRQAEGEIIHNAL